MIKVGRVVPNPPFADGGADVIRTPILSSFNGGLGEPRPTHSRHPRRCIHSKGNRRPGCMLRTYDPSQLPGLPMVPPLSSASLCSTKPLSLRASSVCPLSTCQLASMPPLAQALVPVSPCPRVPSRPLVAFRFSDSMVRPDPVFARRADGLRVKSYLSHSAVNSEKFFICSAITPSAPPSQTGYARRPSIR